MKMQTHDTKPSMFRQADGSVWPTLLGRLHAGQTTAADFEVMIQSLKAGQ
jgi:hypothetical protein